MTQHLGLVKWPNDAAGHRRIGWQLQADKRAKDSIDLRYQLLHCTGDANGRTVQGDFCIPDIHEPTSRTTKSGLCPKATVLSGSGVKSLKGGVLKSCGGTSPTLRSRQWQILFAQIALANQNKSFFDEELRGQSRIVDIKCQCGAAGADKQWVGVVNIDLGGQKRGANHHQRMLRPFRHGYYKQILLGE